MATLEQETITLPPLADEGGRCPSCDSPLASDQRYCLNCGVRRGEPRIPFREAIERGAARRGPAATELDDGPASRDWTPVMTLAGLGTLAIVLVLGILIGRTGSDAGGTPQVVTVGPGQAVGTGAANASLSDASETWPEGKQGWTVELGAIPKDSPTEQVDAARKNAEDKGAGDVGLIDSDNHKSLPGGSWIVYSGVYDSRAQASKTLKGLKRDFPDAQVIEVSDKGANGGGKVDVGNAETLDTQELEQLDNLSGDEYVKKSRKLPDETALPGEPPPTDDKAPGAGSDTEVIE